MRSLTAALRAATAVALVAVPALSVPARAAGGETMVCTLTYDSTAGPSDGRGTCTAVGTFTGTVLLAFHTSNGCPLSTAAGSAIASSGSGALAFSFSWTRVGTTGVATTGPSQQGAGTITFSSPCPANGETAVFSGGGA